VDDLIILGNDHDAIVQFKSYLSDCFDMKDFGILKYYLGVKVAINHDGLFLCQRKYALDILLEAMLLGTKPANVPLEQQHWLAFATRISLGFEVLSLAYEAFYLSLLYSSRILILCSCSISVHATTTRGTLGGGVKGGMISKRESKAGIFLGRDCDLQFYGWCDSDWASCPLTCRSLAGWFISLDILLSPGKLINNIQCPVLSPKQSIPLWL